MAAATENDALHVEVCLRTVDPVSTSSLLMEKLLETPLREYMSVRQFPLNKTLKIDEEAAGEGSDLGKIETLLFEYDKDPGGKTFITENDMKNLIFHFYIPLKQETETDPCNNEAEPEMEAQPSINHWALPAHSFVGLWENLVYQENLKENLLKFALSSLTFSQRNVNQNVICCNRLLLLHGPPGTGKTSLCRALAQKLAIRARHSYSQTHLIEINSHSLFSKWFSESGKLVMRLFSKIRDILSDPHNLVCVLIDEVESIAYARDNMSGQEPRDAMRVVNALLTQLDSLKEHPNVIVLATSNLADTIDMAFLDRADIKQYIGLPSVKAIRHIYESMLLEMMRVGIITKESLKADDRHEGLLNALAERSFGLSGRTLRKLPFLAHAMHTGKSEFNRGDKVCLGDFFDSMLAALEKHQHDQKLMKK